MGLFSSDPNIGVKLAAIERKLDLIIQHLGIEVPVLEGFEEVRELARQGQAIEAIKLYRQQTGVGLAEAKAFVDSLR